MEISCWPLRIVYKDLLPMPFQKAFIGREAFGQGNGLPGQRMKELPHNKTLPAVHISLKSAPGKANPKVYNQATDCNQGGNHAHFTNPGILR